MDDNEQFNAEDQAALEQMRNADAEQPVEQPAVQEEAAADEAQPGQQQTAKHVPLATYMEEKNLRKETERKAAERERLLEERFNAILQRVGQQQPTQQQEVAQMPDRDKDPVGYLEARAARAEEAAILAHRALQERGQVDQRQQVIAAVQAQTTAMENQYRREHPDYDDAATYLAEHRQKAMELLGYTNPADRHTLLQQEAFGLAARAIQERRNPADDIYQLAKYYGYQGPQAQAAAQQDNTEERLQTVARGQEQSRSLSNMRGSAASAPSLKTLSEMNETQFRAWLDKATPEQREVAFGR